MAVRSISNPVLNKISKAEYDARVEAGNITTTMIADQVWLDADVTVPVQHKLIGVEEGAEVNVIEEVKVNNTALTPSSKSVNITVPTKTSDLTNDSNFITTESDPTVPSWAKATTKPSYAYSEITGTPTLATVATSGSYDDLTDKPTIPSVTGLASTSYVDTKVADLVNSAPATLDTLSELATALQTNQGAISTINSAITSKANASDLTALTTRVTTAESTLVGKANTSSLATVATSGSYNDLTDKPTGAVLKIWTPDE